MDADRVVDVESIVKDKAGDKYRYIPKFVVSWLKKILHETEVNRFLSSTRDERGVKWLKSCVRYLDMHIKVIGLENLPPNDGKLYTFVSNHPLGGGDGVALGALIGEHYDGQICYLLNDVLMNLPGLRDVGVPINKIKGQNRDFPRLVGETFGSSKQVLMFPAGICSRLIKGEVHDVPWTKTFISKSVETKRDVVPIHFSGHNSMRFYRLANFGKRLGLKFNIAMLFLVDEMYKNVGKDYEIRIGQPISWQTFQDKSRGFKEWARWVEDRVYSL